MKKAKNEHYFSNFDMIATMDRMQAATRVVWRVITVDIIYGKGVRMGHRASGEIGERKVGKLGCPKCAF